MALEGINLFKDIEQQKGVLDLRRQSFPIDRISNNLGELSGDKVVFNNITGVDLGDGILTGDGCDRDVVCLGSERAEFDLDKGIDKIFKLNNCRVSKLANLAIDTREDIVANASVKVLNRIDVLEVKNHLTVVSDVLSDYTPEPTETDIYSIVEGMISKTETENISPDNPIMRDTDIIVVVSPKAGSEIRKMQLGCCEFLNAPTTPTPNKWGVLDVIVMPQTMMPDDIDIMVYVKDWSLFGEQCKKMEIFEMSDVNRGWLGFDVFERFGSKMLDTTDFPELIGNSGEKYEIVAPTPPLKSGKSPKADK